MHTGCVSTEAVVLAQMVGTFRTFVYNGYLYRLSAKSPKRGMNSKF